MYNLLRVYHYMRIFESTRLRPSEALYTVLICPST